MNSDLTILAKRRKWVFFVRVDDEGKCGGKRVKSVDRIEETVRVAEKKKRKRKAECK